MRNIIICAFARTRQSVVHLKSHMIYTKVQENLDQHFKIGMMISQIMQSGSVYYSLSHKMELEKSELEKFNA